MPSKKSSKKQKDKNSRRIENAEKRIKPSDSVLADLVAGTVKAATSEQDLKRHAVIERLLQSKGQEWAKRTTTMIEHHNAANHDFGEYKIVFQMATEILHDIDTTLKRLRVVKSRDDERPITTLTTQALSCRRFRAYARMHLDDYKGAIEDATEGIAQRAWFRKCSKDKLPTKNEVALCLTRGMSLRLTGRYSEACSDIKAALAALLVTKEKWGGWPSRPETVKQLLIAMALDKVESGTPRPHYTKEEKIKIEKRLGLRQYSRDVYVCGACGVKPSDTVKLSLCSKCNKVWYCGQDCQILDRKKHKKDCKAWEQTRHVWDDREAFIQEIDKMGFKVIGPTHDHVIVRDQDGRLFDSLTDEEVFFQDEALQRIRGSVKLNFYYRLEEHSPSVTVDENGIPCFSVGGPDE